MYPVSSKEADLEANVISALDSVPIASMRRYGNVFQLIRYSFDYFISVSQHDLVGLWMAIILV
jgi:hypothetical protein